LVAARKRILLAITAVVPVVLATGCATGTQAGSAGTLTGTPVTRTGTIPRTPGPAPQTISETGSTLLYPLFQTWASAYHGEHSQVRITAGATGSGAGIAGASGGTADIGASDAYLSSGDMVQNPALLNIPLAISAQQVNYNVPGLRPGVHLRLNGAVLALMYEGKITSWNSPAIAALNPGVHLPATRVVPLHRRDSAGDTFLFTSYLAAHAPAWNKKIGYGTAVAWPAVRPAPAMEGNGEMVAGCKATVGCVAYVGISYLSAALADGLGEAELANTAGRYELPTAASISAAVASFVSSTPVTETISMVNGPAAGGYPIVNYEYAIVASRQPSAAKARDLKAFLHWAITSGNSPHFLNGVRFQPLPASVVMLSDQQIAKIG
jgi:phosphate transport system substrate-binding protein